MSLDDAVLAGQKIVASVRAAFPDEARSVDKILLDDCFEVEESPHIWLEHFSQLTTDAIKAGQFDHASAHLNLISHLLEGADELAVQCIEVAYVESLLWDIKDRSKKHAGWLLIPENLRALYLGMWGPTPFMKDGRGPEDVV
jgi:hypothetical protein